MNILSSSPFFIHGLLREHLGRGEMTSVLKQTLQAELTLRLKLGSVLHWRQISCSLDDLGTELLILCSTVVQSLTLLSCPPLFLSFSTVNLMLPIFSKQQASN